MTGARDTYHFGDFETWLRSWGAAQTTITRRLIVCRLFARQHPDSERVSPDDVTGWLAEPRAAWTRLSYFSHLRSLFGWLTDAGHLDSDPMRGLRRPSTPRLRPRPLAASEIRRALCTEDERLRAWLLLGLYAGLRAHETAKLHGRDVTEEAIYVRGKGGHDAVVPTHPILWTLAQTYPRDDYWFPGAPGYDHIGAQRVTVHTTRWFAELGIEGSYHRCRHSMGTNLLRAGANLRLVSSLMRHQSISTTAYYLGIDEAERTQAIRLLSA